MAKDNNKSKKPITSNTILLAFGVFLCLLVFVLIMDIGYVARTINFIPFYLFGFSAYYFYALVFALGFFYIFISSKKAVKLRKLTVLGLILFGLALSMMITVVKSALDFNLSNFFSEYNVIYNDFYINGTKTPFIIYINSQSSQYPDIITGGFLGYLFDSLLKGIGVWLIYLIAILLMLVALFLVLWPMVKRIKKAINKNKEEKIAQQEKALEGATIEDIEEASETKMKFGKRNDKTFEVIQEASTLDEGTTRSTNIAEEKKPEPTYLNSQSDFNDATMMQGTIGLKKAHFYRDGQSISNTSFVSPSFNSEKPAMASRTPEPTKVVVANEEVEKKVSEEEENNFAAEELMRQSKEEARMEQMNLFEEQARAEQERINSVNTQVVTAKHEFINPNEEVSNRGISFENNNTNYEESEVIPEPVEKRKPKQKYIEPSTDLLFEYDTSDAIEANETTAEQRSIVIDQMFTNFSVGAHVDGYIIGPSVTRYNIAYDVGVSVTKVGKITSDISVALGGAEVRFVPIVPGQSTSGLEIPNAKITTVGFKETYLSLPSREKKPLAVAFGKNVSGQVVWAELDEFPHLLVAGTTGSGKSIFVHSIIMSLIMRTTPDELRIVLVDPKRVEMTKYKDMPHLLCPIITDADQCVTCLERLAQEMEKRYDLLAKYGVSNIKQYNELAEEDETMPYMKYVVVFLDEYADIFDHNKDVAIPVVSIAQKARACGIHLCIATQRPSVNVINGVIKGNLPTRVALMTSSIQDSMVVIDEGGGEKLLGKGDMLVKSPLVSRTGCTRLQGCFVQNKEISKVVEFLKSIYPTEYDPDYIDLTDHSKDAPATYYQDGNTNGQKGGGEFADGLYEDIKKFIMMEEYGSISKIQRQFGIGFTRAGRIFNQLQKDGIVESSNAAKGNAKGCKVLVHDMAYGIGEDVDNSEQSSVESLDEYIENSDRNGGAY